MLPTFGSSIEAFAEFPLVERGLSIEHKGVGAPFERGTRRYETINLNAAAWRTFMVWR